MNGPDIGVYVGQGVTLILALIAIFGKRVASKSDDNDAMKLGNEFLRGLLADAKSEREELRATIEELRDDRKSHEESLARLKALLDQKNERIEQLEATLDRIAEKLSAGESVTLADLVGRNVAATS